MGILRPLLSANRQLWPPRIVYVFFYGLAALGFVAMYFRGSPRFALLSMDSVTGIQERAYAIASNGHRRPTCHWRVFHERRYAPLAYRPPDMRGSGGAAAAAAGTAGDDWDALGTKNVYIAINFYNNEDVLPTFFQEFPLLLRRLGTGHVYVSVYENGSDDRTPQLLALFDEMLTALDVAHTVTARGRRDVSHKENGHRINVLADLRNRAMAPLYDGTAASRAGGRAFDEVLWINDVFHCQADILEVLYQKRLQGAHQACAVDWGGWGDWVIYDRWVLRTMTGRVFYLWEELVAWMYPADDVPRQPDGRGPLPQLLPHDAADRKRLESVLPLQVFSCWNGATAIDAAAFLPPHSLRFRVAQADLDDDGHAKEVTELASECFLSSVDLWKKGLGKIVIAPRASVTYNMQNYELHRKDQLRPLANADDELISWQLKPPAKVAFQDYAAWNEPERWAPWDEQ